MNSRKCAIYDVDVHRASCGKHLRIKKHLENEKQNDMIIPEWLYKEPIEIKYKKIYKYIILNHYNKYLEKILY